MVPGLGIQSEMNERINEEFERLRSLLGKAHPKDYTGLFTAQQALALDPNKAAAPSDLIEGTLEGSTSCYRTAHPESSEHALG